MNPIWFAIMALSIILAIISGKAGALNIRILSDPAEAVMFCFKLMGNMCLWLGIMKVAERAGLVGKAAAVVRPLVKRIFPGIPVEHSAFEAVTASLVANMMGIGNAATAFGLKAMTELKKLSPNSSKASNSMCMFVVVNAFMIQIIHTNTVFIRSISGSNNPTIVLPAINITTLLTFITAIVVTRFYERLWKNL